MTRSIHRRTDIEVVIPYGNPNGALHFRFGGDYLTFCGRGCDDWSVADGTKFSDAVDSAYTCKHCLKAAFK